MISFAFPWLALSVVLPFLVFFLFPRLKNDNDDALKIPFIADLQKIKAQSSASYFAEKQSFRKILQILLLSAAWILLIVAVMRPQIVGKPLPVKNEGRDILLVIDISTSMKEHDFIYNQRYYDRLSAVKFVVDKFIDARKEDRIGLVFFGTRAYMQAPLTYDKSSLKEILHNAEAGMAGNSTSIGDAIGVALKNLALEKSPSKVIILLTDGENNDGTLSMAEAVKMAEDENVKIYTIGAGADEKAFFGGFFSLPTNSVIDEESLKELAKATAGQYFRARDVDSLMNVYKQINKLEPSEKETRFVREVKEVYYVPALGSLILLYLLFGLTARRKK